MGLIVIERSRRLNEEFKEMKTEERKNGDTNGADDDSLEKAMGEILRSVRTVKYGSIEITIHDSRVVQIERKEKVRFALSPRIRPG
jgi:hypothetical protein